MSLPEDGREAFGGRLLRMDGYNRDGYDHTPVATTPPHTWDTCSHVAQPTVYNKEKHEAPIDDPLRDE